MSFVGIISSNEIYEFIKKELLKDNMKKNIELININKSNIQNVKNVKFETIIVCDDLHEMKMKNSYINSIIDNSKYLIINTDNNLENIDIENNNIQIITYGMNQKSTVTASSIKEDEILICLQRNIKNINNKTIEIQEFKKKEEKFINNQIYNYLVIFILEQIYS